MQTTKNKIRLNYREFKENLHQGGRAWDNIFALDLTIFKPMLLIQINRFVHPSPRGDASGYLPEAFLRFPMPK